MTSITRRLFLRHTAAAGAVGATIAAPAVAEAAVPVRRSPDGRIDAAVEEIKAAYREKWPGCSLQILDSDSDNSGFVTIVANGYFAKPGSVRHDRVGLARRNAEAPRES